MKSGSEVSVAARDAVARVLGTLSRPYRWPSEEAKAWVVNFATRACAIDQTRALVMIGSIVRPIATINDVDLLYIYDGEPLSFRHHPLDVDIRALSASDVLKRFEEQQDVIVGQDQCQHQQSRRRRRAVPGPGRHGQAQGFRAVCHGHFRSCVLAY